MSLLQVSDLGFGYGAGKLFEGVTFKVEPGERVALVAPNGAGKSTLLRLVAKELAPDAGTVVIRRDATVGYSRQSHEEKQTGSVLEAFLRGFGDVLELREALREAEHAAASGTDAALAQLARATDKYALAGGDALERRVQIIAQRLGFRDADLERDVTSLSGGERGRLVLGVTLAKEPDLLLLDEPTNHLDLETIAWLEKYLASLSSAALVVSHDRAFLDAVCPSTMELGRRSFRAYPLKYSDYALAREEDLARERALAERHEAFVAKTEDFIRKNIAGQKTKQAQSRRKMLDKLDDVDRPEDVWAVAEKIAFRFATAPRSGDIVLEATGLEAERGGRRLFEPFDLLLRRGDRLGIIGPNGAGKSTLLKLLAGRGGDDDGGHVKRGTNLREGYFDQHLGSLDVTRTAVEEIRSVRGDLNVDGARAYLARFRFYGDDALRKVQGFSGGERSRLALAKLLLEPKNLLFLDEPTNHLDIPAAEILEEALANFDGACVLVSHDRRFLEAVTTRTLVVSGDAQVELYPGGYRDWRDATARRLASKPPPAQAQAPARANKPAKASPTKADPRLEREREQERERQRAREQEREAAAGTSVGASRTRVVKRSGSTATGGPASSASPAPQSQKPTGRAAHEAEKAAARALERKRVRAAELEAEIERGEAELVVMRAALQEDPGGDWTKLSKAVAAEQALTKRVADAMTEWTELSTELAEHETPRATGAPRAP